MLPHPARPPRRPRRMPTTLASPCCGRRAPAVPPTCRPPWQSIWPPSAATAPRRHPRWPRCTLTYFLTRWGGRLGEGWGGAGSGEGVGRFVGWGSGGAACRLLRPQARVLATASPLPWSAVCSAALVRACGDRAGRLPPRLPARVRLPPAAWLQRSRLGIPPSLLWQCPPPAGPAPLGGPPAALPPPAGLCVAGRACGGGRGRGAPARRRLHGRAAAAAAGGG